MVNFIKILTIKFAHLCFGWQNQPIKGWIDYPITFTSVFLRLANHYNVYIRIVYYKTNIFSNQFANQANNHSHSKALLISLSTLFLSPLHIGAISLRLSPSPVRRCTTISGGKREMLSHKISIYASIDSTSKDPFL